MPENTPDEKSMFYDPAVLVDQHVRIHKMADV